MQLYTIGLHYLNDDGTEVVDQFGRVVQTYSNNDILSNSRIWSGFEYTGKILFAWALVTTLYSLILSVVSYQLDVEMSRSCSGQTSRDKTQCE